MTRPMPRQTLFILGAIVAIGLLRFYQLMQYGLEWDEAHLVALAKLPWGELFTKGPALDHHPPLIAAMLKLWLSIAGDSDLAVRLFTWAMGLFGLWGTYLLSKQITNSERIACVTFAMSVLSVQLWNYTHITTFYSTHYAAVIFSWWLLLKFIDDKTPCHSERSEESPANKTCFFAWLAISSLAMYAHTAGAVFLAGQIAYITWQWKSISLSGKKYLLTGAGALTLLYAPFAWLLTQPWHMSHLPWGYPVASFWQLVITPANMMWLGVELRRAAQLPQAGIMLVYVIITYAGLWWGIRKEKSLRCFVVCMALVPMLLLYAASLVSGQGIFQLRTVLYAVFAFNLLWVVALCDLFRGKNLVVSLIMVMIVQWIVPYRFQNGEDIGRMMAEKARAEFQPGDGVVFYPGWMGLVFLRYFDPPAFGLGPQERAIEPEKENYFEMINRMDDRYFMVSGPRILSRPDVAAAFQAFQKAHARVWVMAESLTDIEPWLDCERVYYLWGSDGNFHPATCRKPAP